MRAKFQCYSVTNEMNGPNDDEGKPTKSGESLHLQAVYGTDGSANASWSKATPSGQLTMQVSNPGAFGQVKQGKSYFIDINEAPDEG